MNITIIIPTYNEEKRLEKCLKSIAKQSTNNFTVTTIIVDDNSADKTVNIARKYGAIILRSGYRDIEISKNIGLLHTETELVCFLDADNWFPAANWLMNAREAIKDTSGVIGAQSAWFEFSKSDPLANRYCTLLGCMDPAVFYLGSRDRLTYAEHEWLPAASIVKDELRYWVVSIAGGETRTYGSQGFLTFTDKARLHSIGGRFYHTDFVLDSCINEKHLMVILKTTIGHDGCKNIKDLFKKLYRNITIFQKARDRKYKYNMNKKRLVIVALKLMTCIFPVVDAVKGLLWGPKDAAWLMHIPISFGVGIMYSGIVLKTTLKNAIQKAIRRK